MLPSNRRRGCDSPDGAGNGGGSGSGGAPIERSGAESSDGAVDQVIGAPGVDHPTLEAGEDEAQDAERVAEFATRVAARVEDSVESDFEGVAGLGLAEALDGACGGADDCTGEVGGAGVVLEVFAPGAVGPGGFFREEVLRRGGEVVELLDWNVKVLVGMVDAGVVLILGVA